MLLARDGLDSFFCGQDTCRISLEAPETDFLHFCEQYALAVVICMIAGFVSQLEFSPVDAESSTNEGMEIGSSPPISFFKV